MWKNALHRYCHSTKKLRKFGAQRARTPMLDVSTVFVDNFVDKRILMPGNQQHSPCNRRKPGKKSNFFFFRINGLENAP
jgi:hypothetical protein